MFYQRASLVPRILKEQKKTKYGGLGSYGLLNSIQTGNV
jgi:hypothetical protein